MSKLPENSESSVEVPKDSLWDKIKPWAYMAGMFIGAGLIIRAASVSHPQTDTVTAVEVADTQSVTDQDINIALDGSMMDDYSLYVYLSDASEE